MKNKIFRFILSLTLVTIFFIGINNVFAQDETLPENVKISTTPNSTTVIINSKPGYKTNVSVNCNGNNCQRSASSAPITAEDTKKIQKSLLEQQKALEKLWAQQEEYFKRQNEILKSIWGINFFDPFTF